MHKGGTHVHLRNILTCIPNSWLHPCVVTIGITIDTYPGQTRFELKHVLKLSLRTLLIC